MLVIIEPFLEEYKNDLLKQYQDVLSQESYIYKS